MLIAASYIRTGVRGEPTGIQRILIKMFAEENDLMLCNNLWFIDEGVCGLTPFLTRPGGRQIVKAITETHFDVLVVTDINHAFRNASDAKVTTEYLRSQEVTLLSTFEKPKAPCLQDGLPDKVDRGLCDFYYEREERARKMVDGK